MGQELVVVGPLGRKFWAKKISTIWLEAAGNMLAAFFSLGRELIAAKKQLPHGSFLKMIELDLPFHRRTAHMFMKIASDKRLTNVKHASHLPPHWYTLYALTHLDDATFKRLIKNGTIHPDMQRSEIAKIMRLTNVADDETRVLNLKPIKGKFRTIILDPAWEYDWLSIAGRAKPGYAMQTIEQLEALDVRAWADESIGTHLYCWTTNNFMSEATRLVKHWGFQHRTVLTWEKPPPFGLGSYFRNSTEHVLFATLGDTTTRPAAASIPTHFLAPRGEHSEKPQVFYDIVSKSSYPPYGEANQRKKRKGFTNLYCDVTLQKESETTLEAAE